jgi:hypothetical protein
MSPQSSETNCDRDFVKGGKMKSLIGLLIAISFLVAAPAFAEKPDWAGKGKHAEGQLEEQGKAMDSETDDAVEEMKEKGKAKKGKKWKESRDLGEEAEEELEEADKKLKGAGHKKEQMGKEGFDKQREKKAGQVQKELDKGSERGQEARQKRKKWWKFWEE